MIGTLGAGLNFRSNAGILSVRLKSVPGHWTTVRSSRFPDSSDFPCFIQESLDFSVELTLELGRRGSCGDPLHVSLAAAITWRLSHLNWSLDRFFSRSEVTSWHNRGECAAERIAGSTSTAPQIRQSIIWRPTPLRQWYRNEIKPSKKCALSCKIWLTGSHF